MILSKVALLSSDYVTGRVSDMLLRFLLWLPQKVALNCAIESLENFIVVLVVVPGLLKESGFAAEKPSIGWSSVGDLITESMLE